MTSPQRILIALDQGSSSSRAFAVNYQGRVVARAQFPVGASRPKPGWVEQDARELLRSLERALDAVIAELPLNADIIGLGIACQRSTVVFWDKKTGAPVAAAPSWQDSRARKLVEKMAGHRESLHKMTGLYLSPHYSAPKIRWFLDNNSAARRLLKSGRLLVGPVSAYALWKLSHGEIFAVDPTLAQRTMLMNLDTLQWDARLLQMFDIPRRLLPEIKPSVGEWGAIKRRGRVIPVLSCAGDQQAAVMGLGGLKVGRTLANYGTGAFLLHNSGKSNRRRRGLLTSVGWKIEGQSTFFLQEGPVNAAGAAFDWLAQLGIIKKSDNLDKLFRLSRKRLWILPAAGGADQPRWDYGAKMAVSDLGAKTRGADIARAMAESIAFLIADIAAAMRLGGLKLQSVRASGGLSRLDYLLQFQADILGLKVLRLAEADATSLGAAALSALALGDAAWAARIVKTKVERVFKPRMPRAKARELVSQWKREGVRP